MAARQPCYRHPRDTWMAGCPDCTAWHQDELATKRSTAGTPAHGRRAITAERGTSGDDEVSPAA